MESESDPWSVPTLELFRRFDVALDDESNAVVATVVDVEGSSYRRPGAKMLFEGGVAYGGITAGCLEGPLAAIADTVAETGIPVLETFDLTEGGEWDIGLGCNGIVDVFVEPLDERWRDPVGAYLDGKIRTTITTIGSGDGLPTGTKSILDAENRPIDGSPGTDLPREIVEVVLDEIDPGRLETTTLSVEHETTTIDLFIDRIEPAISLVVFGAQPDVRPVTELARTVGMDTTVVTPRGGRSAESFPSAHRVVSAHPTDLRDAVDERSFVVVMSHNYLDDLLALEALLETDVPYIGVMGPRDRFSTLCDDLENEGIVLTDQDHNRIAAPVGLDLGGGEPTEIALSIVAEVLALSNDRAGGRLGARTGPIHERASPHPD